jgi:hypothetical protein
MIRIEGRLLCAQAEELEKDLGTSSADATIDLAGLSSAEPAAIRVLQKLEDDGARLTGGSVYVRHLLTERRRELS